MAQPDDMFGDDDYPAYTMGRAAEIVGTSPDFLRRLDEAKLITPSRSAGGHRRYSRYQLRLAARAREMVDQGTALEAACRIIILEDQLEEALRQNAEHEQRSQSDNAWTGPPRFQNTDPGHPWSRRNTGEPRPMACRLFQRNGGPPVKRIV